MTISELQPRPIPTPDPRRDLSSLKPGISLLRHDDGRQGIFVSIEPDGRLQVQSLKGKGFWVFHPDDCDLMARQDPATAPKPADRRQAAKATTRVRILAAARALFEAGSYADATIRSIARAAGMSTGAVFATVPDKAALWTAVYGGPPPSDQIADEIARTLGQLPNHSWAITYHPKAGWEPFHASIAMPGFPAPGFHGSSQPGITYGGSGQSPAAALRKARESLRLDTALRQASENATDALRQARETATHAVRQEAS